MDKHSRLRSPNVKRKIKVQPIDQRVTLEHVLGFTLQSNTGLTCDVNTGTIAYPAGCVVVLFNPKRKKQTHLFNCCKKTITTLAFSKDGKHLVTGEAGHSPAVRVWDVEEKSQVAEFHGHNFRVNCVAFFPNSKYIVSIGSQHDKMVNVWNWKTGNKVASNKVSSKVQAVSFSEDGSNFVTVGHRHVKFWYLDSSKSKINAPRPLSGRNGLLGEHKNNNFCDVACGRGRQANNTYCITQSGLLCQFNEKRLLDKWAELRSKSANCISVGEDFIFVGCAEGTVRIFNSESLFFISSLPCPHYLGVDVSLAITPSQVIHPKEARFPDTMAIVYDDYNRKVTCVYNDHSLYVWDVHDIKKVGKIWSFLYHSSCIWGLDVYPSLDNNNNAMLPPGSFITSSGDDTIRVWNTDPHLPDNTAYKHNIYSNELIKVIYGDPSHAYLCDNDYQVSSADKADNNYDSKNGIRSIRVSPDGKHLATGDREGNIKIYDIHFMDDVRKIEAHDGDVLCLEYHYVKGGPRLLATASRDRLIHVFDVDESYGLLLTLDEHSSSITAIKFASNGDQLKLLSCGADKSILFRNATMTPDLQFNVDQHLASKAKLYDMILDPSHKFVATACHDRNVRIYSIAKAKQKKNYKGTQADDGVLLRLQLDPSGSYVATTCTDKSICIVDFYTGEIVATMYGHSEVVTGIQFTNDLKHIISVSSDGCIFIWKLPNEMTKQMKSRMEGQGKISKDIKIYDDLQKERNDISDRLDLHIHDTIPVLDSMDYKSPAKVLDMLQDTPKRPDLDYRFSVGELPNWAKNKLSDVQSEASDSSNEGQQPRGRWAARADTKVSLLSQLEKSNDSSIMEDRRRFPHEAEALQQQIAELRRETMVLSQQSNNQNIPIIDDDDDNEINLDDEEDFFPSYAANSSIDTTDGKSPSYSTQSLGRKMGSAGRKWGSRTNFSFDFDDVDEDFRTETPEVIYYPENDLESVQSYESSYSVFANKANKPLRKYGILDDDSESTDPVSLDDMEDEDDSTGLSNPGTPSDPDREFLATTPDKDKFVKENFENIAFTPIAPDKFHKVLDHIEEELNSNAVRPFSPRLSISARFLSRAQQAGLKSTFAGMQRQESWLDMGWDADQDNEDDTKPPSPPTKLESNSHSFSKLEDLKTTHTYSKLDDIKTTHSYTKLDDLKSSHSYGQIEDIQSSPNQTVSSGRRSTPPPKSPRRFWLTNEQSKQLREKRLSLPKIPISKFMQTQMGKKPHPQFHYHSRLPDVKSPLPRKMVASPVPRIEIYEEDEDDISTSSSSSSTRLRGSQPNLRYVKTEDKRRSTPNLRSSLESNLSRSPEGKRGSGGRSYLRPTKSSNAKNFRSTSASSLPGVGVVEQSHTNGLSKSSSLTNLASAKEESQPQINNNQRKTRQNQLRKGRLSSSKLAQYASTPNLACVEEDEEEDPPSNLVNLGHLTKSVPDINDLDTNSTDTVSSTEISSKTLPSISHQRSALRTRFSGFRKDRESSLGSGGASIDKRVNSRRSLNVGDTLSAECQGVRRSLSPLMNQNRKSESGLMPPPLSTNVTRKKPESILKHSVKRRSQPELTLDEAKDILMGRSKSGSGSGRDFFSKDSDEKKSTFSVHTAEKPDISNNMTSTNKLDASSVPNAEDKHPSVKDRIAQYYSHVTPPKDNNKSQSKADLRASPEPPPGIVTSSTSLDFNISSRSQSDTGVGSDTDTDSEIKRPDKTTSHPRLSLANSNHDMDNGVSLTTPVVTTSLDQLRLDPIKVSRSKLSLPVTPDYNSQDFFTNCSQAVSDLKNSIQRLKQIHKQSCSMNDENSEQVQALLGQAFQEAHHTFADLSAKTTTGKDNSITTHSNTKDDSKYPAEKDQSEEDIVLAKAMALMEPLLNKFSNRISDQIVDKLQNKLV